MRPDARRYYTDSYATSFDAVVVERLTHDGHPAVVLDGTLFYPTSGGQPHDVGALDQATVVDVLVRESDGAVVHVLEGPVAADRVSGRIDWPRRFDYMQQHTGQHILSQAFVRAANATTIGFHLGDSYVSIDLDAGGLAESTVETAFETANAVVTADIDVRAWFPTADELATLSLRKTPEVEGALRVVAVGDFDVSACGGTHVHRTGEIGLIHHLRTERLKRGTRIAFLCGARARRDYAAKHAIVRDLSARLTCSAEELPAAVHRLEEDQKTLRQKLKRHEEQALDREAADLHAGAERAGGRLVVASGFAERPAEELRHLVLRLTEQPHTIALLGSSGSRAQFVFGRSEPDATDLRPALQAALAAIGGGRGGGSRIVQGGGGAATPEQIGAALAVARRALDT